MKNPFVWYNKFGTIPSSYREAMSYEEQILWLCQQIENLKLGSANYNYNLLENKPSINGVTLQGNVTSTQLGLDLNYNFLMNKPSINNVMLQGNKSLSELGIQEKLVAGSGIRIVGNTISATGGGGGTSDYDYLENRPKLNGITITGDKSDYYYGISKSLNIEHEFDFTGEVYNMSGYQVGDIVPQKLDTVETTGGGSMLIHTYKNTYFEIKGNFDLYIIHNDNKIAEIFTTENRVEVATHLAQEEEDLIFNFYNLGDYTHYCIETMRGETIEGEIKDSEENIKYIKHDVDKLFSVNFPITEINTSSASSYELDYYFNIGDSNVGQVLPAKTSSENTRYYKVAVTDNFASHFVIEGEARGCSMWFTTTGGGLLPEVILSASQRNLYYSDYGIVNVDIPDEANYIYFQFTNTDLQPSPRVFGQKITALGGTEVTHLDNTIVLLQNTTPTLETGFYVVDNGSVYIGSQLIVNLVYGAGEIFYYDSTNKIFYGSFKSVEQIEGNWSILENAILENSLTDSRNKIPTSHAVYEAIGSSGSFYTTLTETLTLNLDGTNSLNLTDGYYLTDLVQYYDDNGLNTASYLSYNFCYYNSSQKRLTLTGIQKGLTYYDTFARYIDSTDGWLYSYKQFVNVLDNSKISTSISSSSTNSQVAGALACYEASLDTYENNTERVVGTWTDGRPLYRFDYYVASISAGTTNSFDLTSYGIDSAEVKRYDGGALLGGTTFAKIPYLAVGQGGVSNWLTSSVRPHNNVSGTCEIFVNTTYNLTDFTASIWYTKASDLNP